MQHLVKRTEPELDALAPPPVPVVPAAPPAALPAVAPLPGPPVLYNPVLKPPTEEELTEMERQQAATPSPEPEPAKPTSQGRSLTARAKEQIRREEEKEALAAFGKSLPARKWMFAQGNLGKFPQGINAPPVGGGAVAPSQSYSDNS